MFHVQNYTVSYSICLAMFEFRKKFTKSTKSDRINIIQTDELVQQQSSSTAECWLEFAFSQLL